MTNTDFFKDLTVKEKQTLEAIMDNTNLKEIEFQSISLKTALNTMFGEGLVALYIYADTRGIAEDLESVVSMSVDLYNALNRDNKCELTAKEAVAIITDLNAIRFNAIFKTLDDVSTWEG